MDKPPRLLKVEPVKRLVGLQWPSLLAPYGKVCEVCEVLNETEFYIRILLLMPCIFDIVMSVRNDDVCDRHDDDRRGFTPSFIINTHSQCNGNVCHELWQRMRDSDFHILFSSIIMTPITVYLFSLSYHWSQFRRYFFVRIFVNDWRFRFAFNGAFIHNDSGYVTHGWQVIHGI